MVAPLTYAPNHQHFFNVRLDFALDGIKNTVQQCDVVADKLDEVDNPYENAFHVETKELKYEKEARAHLCLETSRTWKVVNKNAKNYMGQSVGFKLLPGKYFIDASRALGSSVARKNFGVL